MTPPIHVGLAQQSYKKRARGAVSHNNKEGIDYEENFSLVTMLKSIIILLFIAAHYD